MREIKLTDITREELWAKQRLSFTDIDYAVWERNKSMLHQFSKMNRNCTFVVDVYKCRYAYASPNFVDLLGYDAHKIATLERQGDYLESRIHPDDREQLLILQIKLSQFIYSLPPEQRNDYSNIYSFRVLNARQQYVRVVSRHQVLEQTIDTMIGLLNPGGRLSIITFHSLEDRIVKNKFRDNENPCICPPDFPVCVCRRKSRGKVVTRKPILPTEAETEENKRSKSAKLRVFERR